MSNLQFVNSNTAYALCFNSVMKSTNTGNNWSVYYTDHSQNNASLHFINETTGFIVSDTGIVLKTLNGGANWSVISNFNQKKFHKIYFTDNNTGYLLRYNDTYGYRGTSLYRTTSGGQNWSNIISDTSITIRDINFISSQSGYAAGYGNVYPYGDIYAKIFRTTNTGLTWDTINTLFNCRITGIQYRNNTLFAYGNRAYPSSRGMFLSTNLGASWISSEISRDVVDISYVEPNNIYATATNSGVFLYKSINNGINWSNIGSDIKSTEIEFINSTTGISVGGMGNVHKTTNSGVNWNSQITQLAYYIWEVDFSNANTGYAADQGGLLKTTNGGINWTKIFNRGLYKMDFIDANTGYFGGQDSLFKTTNGGLTFTQVHYTNTPGVLNEIQFLNSNTGFILGKNNTTWKTTNGGTNWSILSGYGIGYHECLYFQNENLGFIGRSDYNLGWGVSRTTNGGLNWDFQTFPNVNNYIFDFAFINSTTGFFSTGGRIFKTTNSGNDWYNVFDQQYYPFYDIWSIQFISSEIGFATFGGNILKSTDAGNTWNVHNSITNNGLLDLYFTDVNTGYFVGSGGVILKTTNGGGSPIGIEPISSIVPDKYMLYQNYPNPFNPVTKIKFAIPNSVNGRNEITTLKIFDILGKEVAVPVNEILPPGEYEIEWEAREYPSGVYFCRMNHGSNVFTVRIVLLK